MDDMKQKFRMINHLTRPNVLMNRFSTSSKSVGKMIPGGGFRPAYKRAENMQFKGDLNEMSAPRFDMRSKSIKRHSKRELRSYKLSSRSKTEFIR